MTVTSRSSHWPLILISTALVVLTLAAVGAGHLYWTGLTQGLGEMQESIAQAREREHQLNTRLQAANEALNARAAELDQREAMLAGRNPAVTPAQPPPPRRNLSAEDWRLLSERLPGLIQQAGQLPAPLQPLAVPVNAVSLLIGQLRVAEIALALRDSLLLDLGMTAAQRVLLLAYGPESEPAMALAGELARLRASLRRLPDAAETDNPDPENPETQNPNP